MRGLHYQLGVVTSRSTHFKQAHKGPRTRDITNTVYVCVLTTRLSGEHRTQTISVITLGNMPISFFCGMLNGKIDTKNEATANRGLA